MPILPQRVVLDTNILVRGLINRRSDSGRILLACEDRRIVSVLSKPLLSEYRSILNDPKLVARYSELEPARVKIAVERLMYVGDLIATDHMRFEYFRDRKDEKLIVLSIAGRATHLISTDRDLLDLPEGRGEAARRFRQRAPNVQVMTPDQFVAGFGPDLGIDRV